MRLSRLAWSLLMLGALILSACDPAQGIPSPTAGALALTATPTRTPSPTATRAATATPTATATRIKAPTPTAAQTPMATLVATQTATPTPAPTPTHPLMIEVMRRGTYPGSEITIEKTLDPGTNYDRYIASYLAEGFTIYALLTVPQGQKPESGWPTIVFDHGYIRPDQYRTTERYVAYVDALARSKYIVFRPDYRGHGSSEGEARSAYGSPDYTVDVLNAVSSLKRYPDADPERIGMWGHSMGGHITLRAMVVSGDIKAGVIWAGVVAPYPDLFERWRRRGADRPTPTPDPTRTRRRWRQELLDTYGSPEENPKFWASVSPTSYLADLSGPLQLHHGTADDSVPVKFSEDLYARLVEIDQPAELHTYKDDDHNISNSFGTAMQRTIQFLNKHVK